MTTRTDKDYLASHAPEWNYPPIDPAPPLGVTLNILTIGGQSVKGVWDPRPSAGHMAWSHMLKRNKEKEQQLREMKGTDYDRIQVKIKNEVKS